MTARTVVTATIFRPVRRAIDLFGSISDSSLIPSGVISKAQENASAIGNPTTRIRMTICIAHCGARSEEHTSELQSHVNLVCRLLLEKKKTKKNRIKNKQ